MDWGPFPALAACLAGASKKPLYTALNLLSSGAPLWKNQIWQQWERKSISLRNDITDQLNKCYSWLGACLAQEIITRFAPFWKDLPLETLAVSDTALAWGLYACSVDLEGPNAVQDAKFGFEKYRLDENASPGDVLCLHWLIERLAKQLEEKNRLAPYLSSKVLSPGGLRTKAFLSVFSTLKAINHPIDADRRRLEISRWMRLLSSGNWGKFLQERKIIASTSGWWRALQPMIKASPLTCLIYADVIESDDAVSSYAGLHPLIYADQVREKGYPPKKLWRALWLSMLAKSMLGAWLSAPPGLPAWQKQKDKVARLIQEQSARRANASDLRTAQAYLQKLSIDLSEQYVARLLRMSSILKGDSWGLPQPGTAEAESNPDEVELSTTEVKYLRIQFQNLLIQHTISCSIQEMMAEWKSLPYKDQTHPQILFGEKGNCYKTFVDQLFGEEAVRSSLQSLQKEKQDALIESLKVILDPPADRTEKARISQQTGIPEDIVSNLLNSFAGEGLESPFCPDDLLHLQTIRPGQQIRAHPSIWDGRPNLRYPTHAAILREWLNSVTKFGS